MWVLTVLDVGAEAECPGAWVVANPDDVAAGWQVTLATIPESQARVWSWVQLLNREQTIS